MLTKLKTTDLRLNCCCWILRTDTFSKWNALLIFCIFGEAGSDIDFWEPPFWFKLNGLFQFPNFINSLAGIVNSHTSMCWLVSKLLFIHMTAETRYTIPFTSCVTRSMNLIINSFCLLINYCSLAIYCLSIAFIWNLSLLVKLVYKWTQTMFVDLAPICISEPILYLPAVLYPENVIV